MAHQKSDGVLWFFIHLTERKTNVLCLSRGD